MFSKKVRIFEYYTVAGGSKRIFTDQDALKEYGTQHILDPESYSYSNLFINKRCVTAFLQLQRPKRTSYH
ncbi:DUF4183 domain-containing protein [Priestia megaterium]|uniref:DUF4183 domain-containing protein n=1 Tax=Priestia megaterium TaxID=1404 RepID=UPI002814ABF3|nr:DUF4183 domain-containing protein [Priestia megaterium]